MYEFEQGGRKDEYGVEVDEGLLRGEEHTQFLNLVSGGLLRVGINFKLLSLILMAGFYIGFGGRWIFSFSSSYGEMPINFHGVMCACMAIYLVGVVALIGFQSFMADDAKWTMGFRIGSKLLSCAVLLDLIGSMLRLVQYLYLYSYMTVVWWSRYNVTQSQWILFSLHNFLDGLAHISYGFGLCYLEFYHDEGTSERYAWWILSLNALSAIFSFMQIFAGYGAPFAFIFTVMAQFVTSSWSFEFEPLLHKWEPDLHSRAINTEVIPNDQRISSNCAPASYQPDPQIPIPPQLQQQNNTYNQFHDLPTHYDYSQIQAQTTAQQPYGIVME